MTQVITPFTARLVRALKAELARRDMHANSLIESIGISKNSLYSKLRGEKSFELDEIAKAVESMGMDMETLFASAALEDRATEKDVA